MDKEVDKEKIIAEIPSKWRELTAWTDRIYGETKKLCLGVLPPWDNVSKSGNMESAIDEPTKEYYKEFDVFYDERIREITKCNAGIISCTLGIVSAIVIRTNDSPSPPPAPEDRGDVFSNIKDTMRACVNIMEDYFVQMTKLSIYWTRNNQVTICEVPVVSEGRDKEEVQKNRSVDIDAFSKASRRFHLFVELCKLKAYFFVFYNSLVRVAGKNGNPWDSLQACGVKISDFPTMVSWKLAFPRRSASREKNVPFAEEEHAMWYPVSDGIAEKKKTATVGDTERKISLFSQFDLEECFRILLYRWKMVDYHDELEKYVSLLVTRACCLIAFNGESERFRTPRSKNAVAVSTAAKPDVSSRNPYLDVETFFFTITDRTISPNPVRLCNFDYVHRQECRFFEIMEKLHRMNFRRILIRSPTSSSTTIPPLVPNKEDVKSVSAFFESWIKRWSTGSTVASSTSELRNRYLQLLMPTCDVWWLKYLYPSQPSNVTNVFRKLHETTYQAMTVEAGRSPAEVVMEKSVATRKLRDELIFQTLETLFLNCDDGPGGTSGTASDVQRSSLREFLLKEDIEDSVISATNTIHKPFLAYLFSRLYVHFYRHSRTMAGGGGSSSSATSNEGRDGTLRKEVVRILPYIFNPNHILNPNARKALVLYACVDDETIYDVLGRLFIYLRDFFPRSKKTLGLWKRLKEHMYAFNG